MTTHEARPWSPYAVGAALGALEWFSFATAKRGLGVSAPFETAAVISQQEFGPTAPKMERFVAVREDVPAIDWEFALATGVVLGSWMVTRGDAPAARAVPALWARRFGSSIARRYGAAFVGGALMMLGARTARGCTSGHGITGTLQLAASSWLFSAVMGASALAATRLLFGSR